MQDSVSRASGRDRVSEVDEYFGVVGDLYAEYWNDFFHFAVFSDEGQSWEEAFEETHQAYMRDLRLERTEKVLVLGCGRGGFADIIARSSRAQVLGIDISRSQLSKAKRFKRSNLRFRRHDIMEVDQIGELFDAAVCLDAACYLPDKERAIEGIAAVLSSGARLLIVDWCRAEGLSELQRELVLEPFMTRWAIPGLASQRDYRRYCRRHGFRILRAENLNRRVRRNWDHAYRKAVEVVRELAIGDLPGWVAKSVRVGPRGLEILKEQFAATLYLKAAFDAGFLEYTYVLAEKAS